MKNILRGKCLFKIIAPLVLFSLFASIEGRVLDKKAEEEVKTYTALVVLDPGHGGRDPGAIGPNRVYEKTVTLGIALVLKQRLEENGIKVILTRDKDVFIPLKRRAEIANKARADTFVSIHINAARRGARGFETYFLSLNASDDEARKTAMLENGAVRFESVKSGGLPSSTDSDLAAILLDMAQTEYIRDSEVLAVTIQDQLDAILRSPNRGVKQAPFSVLMGAAMPAALVEIGFVTNRNEVLLLTEPLVQDKIAQSLCIGIAKFAKQRAVRMGMSQQPNDKKEKGL